MSQVTLVGLALLAVLLLIGKTAVTLIMTNEYATWAPAVARVLVRLAGFICRSRRRAWIADVLFVQHVEHGSGVIQALGCLTAAPMLMARDLSGRVAPSAVRSARLRWVTMVLLAVLGGVAAGVYVHNTVAALALILGGSALISVLLVSAPILFSRDDTAYRRVRQLVEIVRRNPPKQ